MEGTHGSVGWTGRDHQWGRADFGWPTLSPCVCNPVEQSLRADGPDPGDRNIDGPFGLSLPEVESGVKPTAPNSFPERRESKYPAGKQFWADKEMR